MGAPRIPEQCVKCLHFFGMGELAESDWASGVEPIPPLICKAFPKRIPDAIATGKHDHREPYKGDNGIRFEPLKP